MKIIIKPDDLSDGKVAELLNSHFIEMHKYSPAESIHALDAEKLKDPRVTFWSARVNGDIAGCGALKEISKSSGEIKSMKTNNSFLRKGIAEKLLNEILKEAKQRAYTEINLETGSHEAFIPAISLYKKYGFKESEPFGDYKLDPYSKYFKKLMI